LLGLPPLGPFRPSFGATLRARRHRSVKELRKTTIPDIPPVYGERSPGGLITVIPKHRRRNTKRLVREHRAVRRPVVRAGGRTVLMGGPGRRALALLTAKDVAEGRLRRAVRPCPPLFLGLRRQAGVALGRACC